MSEPTSFQKVADIFESNGNVSCSRKDNAYSVRIDINHRSSELLEEVLGILECGNIHKSGSWQWRLVITGNDNCRNVLQVILPFLSKKRLIAELAFQLAESTARTEHYMLTPEEKSYRESLYHQIRKA